jgi:(3,5-dihydroxyphenyl)acetyl-CoA 1,2-dioxygenase
MNIQFFKNYFQSLNLTIENENIKSFVPIVSQDFKIDKINFSNFWKECENENNKIKDKKERKKIRGLIEITKKIFLNNYSNKIYNHITSNRNKFVKIDELVNLANNVVPYLTPSKEQLIIEKNKILKEKEGIETDQGLFLSAVLSNQLEGNHLCHSMLLPSDLALEKQEELIKTKKVQFDGASVEKFEKHILVTLENGEYLNAEDERTLLPLEAAIDLAILDKDTDIAVLRGEVVKHPKYAGSRTFGAGINLTHLYQGQISFLWYIKRDMGAVNKVFRGLTSEHSEPENSLFPLQEKPWIATLDTFAIGGGCQYLLVMDHIMAEKGSYMTLPARKEGIIPGMANLRLWRFTGDRIARQAIQNGLTINSDSTQGKLICDEIIEKESMDKSLLKTIDAYTNSGVVGSASNRRAFRIGQEPLDTFRKYMSAYCHDQAYCHFSDALIKNLENYWDAASRPLK